jgi:hypothetical protein
MRGKKSPPARRHLNYRDGRLGMAVASCHGAVLVVFFPGAAIGDPPATGEDEIVLTPFQRKMDTVEQLKLNVEDALKKGEVARANQEATNLREVMGSLQKYFKIKKVSELARQSRADIEFLIAKSKAGDVSASSSAFKKVAESCVACHNAYPAGFPGLAQ